MKTPKLRYLLLASLAATTLGLTGCVDPGYPVAYHAPARGYVGVNYYGGSGYYGHRHYPRYRHYDYDRHDRYDRHHHGGHSLRSHIHNRLFH